MVRIPAFCPMSNSSTARFQYANGRRRFLEENVVVVVVIAVVVVVAVVDER